MLREDRVRREDRLGAFGDPQGPVVGRLHDSRGAEVGSGAVLVDKKALPLIQLVTCYGCSSRQRYSASFGVHKVHQRRPTSSHPPLQGRHPRANRRTLIDPIPTVLTQVTAACPVLIASNMCPRASPPRGEVEGDVLECPRLDIQPRRT
jgi:hypothetical protein